MSVEKNESWPDYVPVVLRGDLFGSYSGADFLNEIAARLLRGGGDSAKLFSLLGRKQWPDYGWVAWIRCAVFSACHDGDLKELIERRTRLDERIAKAAGELSALLDEAKNFALENFLCIRPEYLAIQPGLLAPAFGLPKGWDSPAGNDLSPCERQLLAAMHEMPSPVDIVNAIATAAEHGDSRQGRLITPQESLVRKPTIAAYIDAFESQWRGCSFLWRHKPLSHEEMALTASLVLGGLLISADTVRKSRDRSGTLKKYREQERYFRAAYKITAAATDKTPKKSS